MREEMIFHLSDSMTDLRLEIDGIRSFLDLMVGAYAEPPASSVVRGVTVHSVERLQNNLFTLFDLVSKALDDAKNAEELADRIFESSDKPA